MQLDGPIISTVPLCPLLMLFGTYFHSRHRTPIFRLRLSALCPAIRGEGERQLHSWCFGRNIKSTYSPHTFAVTGKKFGLFHWRMYLNDDALTLSDSMSAILHVLCFGLASLASTRSGRLNQRLLPRR